MPVFIASVSEMDKCMVSIRNLKEGFRLSLYFWNHSSATPPPEKTSYLLLENIYHCMRVLNTSSKPRFSTEVWVPASLFRSPATLSKRLRIRWPSLPEEQVPAQRDALGIAPNCIWWLGSSSGECGVLLHWHYSQVHSDLYHIRSVKNHSNSIELCAKNKPTKNLRNNYTKYEPYSLTFTYKK